MLSIGVTFWDGDYQFYDRVVSQLNENVKVPFELIVIDNTEENKLGDKATFAFGYNAHQFAARYKIIKLAKGDYLWFIDGDDEILEIDKSLFDKPFDMLCTSYVVDDEVRLFTDREITDTTDHWNLMQYEISQALWNKIIKRDLFNNIDDFVDNPLLEACTLEDSFYIAVALKNAKVILSDSRIIYKKHRGISDSLKISHEGFDNLITGFSEIIKLFKKLGYDTDMIMQHHQWYLTTFIDKSDEPDYIIFKILELFKDKKYWEDNYYRIIMNFHRKSEYESFKNAYVKRFGEVPKMHCVATHVDGTVEDIYFESIPEYIE